MLIQVDSLGLGTAFGPLAVTDWFLSINILGLCIMAQLTENSTSVGPRPDVAPLVLIH